MLAAVAGFFQSNNPSGTLGGKAFVGTGGTHIVNYTSGTAPTAPTLVASSGGVAAAKPAPAVALKQSDLDAIKAAIRRWQTVGGLIAKQVTALKAVSLSIAKFAGQTHGLASGGNRITIDNGDAGHGWYFDATPGDDEEFAARTSATRLHANPTSAPAGRMDLLTAVMHEMGHILGLGHADGDREDLMFDVLASGERRLPAQHEPVR